MRDHGHDCWLWLKRMEVKRNSKSNGARAHAGSPFPFLLLSFTFYTFYLVWLKQPVSGPHPTPGISAAQPKSCDGCSVGGGTGPGAGSVTSPSFIAELPPHFAVSAAPQNGVTAAPAGWEGGCGGGGVKGVSGGTGSPDYPPGVWEIPRGSTTGSKRRRVETKVSSSSNCETREILVISRNPAGDLPIPLGPPIAIKPLSQKRV